MDGNEAEEGVNLEMPSKQTTALDILAEILQIVCFAAVKMTTSVQQIPSIILEICTENSYIKPRATFVSIELGNISIRKMVLTP